MQGALRCFEVLRCVAMPRCVAVPRCLLRMIGLLGTFGGWFGVRLF